jgi:hypothetical protein
MICQGGTTASDAKRNTITKGMAGGMKDIQEATLPLGSRTICSQTNKGQARTSYLKSDEFLTLVAPCQNRRFLWADASIPEQEWINKG